MKKYYIEEFFPGSFVSDNGVREIKSPTDFKLSERAFAYRIFEREFAVVDGEELLGKPKNHSKRFYLGKEYSDKEAIAANPTSDTLRYNIEGNEWKRMVETKYGQWFPLYENDVVIADAVNKARSND